MAGSLNTQSGQQHTRMERNYRVSPDGVHVGESFSKPIHRVEEFNVEPVNKPNFFTIFQEDHKLGSGACRKAGETAQQLRAVAASPGTRLHFPASSSDGSLPPVPQLREIWHPLLASVRNHTHVWRPKRMDVHTPA